MNVKKIVFAAALLTATHSPVRADMVGAAAIGGVCGFGFEKMLYHLPLDKSILGSLGLGMLQVCFCSLAQDPNSPASKNPDGEGVDAKTVAVSALAALTSGTIFYMMEKEKSAVKEERQSYSYSRPSAGRLRLSKKMH